MDLTSHDLIAYEENTDPEHQLVIIGHEAWHMFEGHSGTGHVTTAARAGRGETAQALAEFVALIAEAADTDLPSDAPMDVALHFAARTDARHVHEELDAERFGCRFATDLLAALEDTRLPDDPQQIAGRIKASMAHRFRQM
ncbi:hypothetical protein AQJ43_37045 [Streptomyces avermitilis]|uniref:Toxin-antitoxin system, toxin component n=2 Tax=Streptomyces avermitilis TaxID=33903 RepID=A0A143SZN1_STRAW|nr:hypothetical protein [Streptomyces avermitilis]KUN47755.1 hypothetical protein AQJ43_37045 [Streptomyces avermitilis]BAU77509.1 hypothetical protein SAVERM_2p065 [Streptomyces avermitilis MA-4680 = NBRC 14893]BBJ56274.1 hypothetical protein SAVMC3_89030 [Streptomyces avermitilis]GDY70178.1 hypothetical protein SAV14893_095710 [Streptomyces avermitilis]GDY80476.1 hypothetical protein SAV31267_099610 [Streptomyces avermitilis]